MFKGKTPHALRLSQIVMTPQLAPRGALQSDLGPLPLPELSEAEGEYAWKGAAAWRVLEYDEREGWQPKAWMMPGIHTIKELNLGRRRALADEAAQRIGPQKPDAAQLAALHLHADCGTQFIERARQEGPSLATPVNPAVDWVAELKKVKVGYTGETVRTPEVLILARVVKSLQPAKAAASMPAVEVAEGRVAPALIATPSTSITVSHSCKPPTLPTAATTSRAELS